MLLNLISNDVQEMAQRDRFILPLWQHAKRVPFMVLILRYTPYEMSTRYTLKKVIEISKAN